MIYVNGRAVDAGAEATIRDVLLELGIDPDGTGIAVAVDAEVARRADWATRTLPDGATVEIVRAVQGG
ncbi:MAG TPA: sulfur carrier protein ThiS [Solirubrobacteraceae bacterium]|nr:sulfur carrier protein ThiS [Solirubrobacteraceae bacterium]